MLSGVRNAGAETAPVSTSTPSSIQTVYLPTKLAVDTLELAGAWMRACECRVWLIIKLPYDRIGDEN